MNQVCEKSLMALDGQKALCVRAFGHKGSCIGLRKHAAEADAFQRGVNAMKKAIAAHASMMRCIATEESLADFVMAMPAPEDEL